MSLTITELQEKLKHIDEISLMEVLEITSEDLVIRFIDKIDEKFDELSEEFEDEELENDFPDLEEALEEWEWNEDLSDDE